MAIIPVDIQKSYRILNHGATTIISAQADGVVNAMAASWVCPLDFDKITIVPDKKAFTRSLIEKSGYFAVQIPIFPQKDLLLKLGTESRFDNPNKMENVEFFYQKGYDIPLIKGCAAWLVCERIIEPHNEKTYDLFIGKTIAAWSDDRIFDGGHWLFENIADELKTLHYVAGNTFYIDGKKV